MKRWLELSAQLSRKTSGSFPNNLATCPWLLWTFQPLSPGRLCRALPLLCHDNLNTLPGEWLTERGFCCSNVKIIWGFVRHGISNTEEVGEAWTFFWIVVIHTDAQGASSRSWCSTFHKCSSPWVLHFYQPFLSSQSESSWPSNSDSVFSKSSVLPRTYLHRPELERNCPYSGFLPSFSLLCLLLSG